MWKGPKYSDWLLDSNNLELRSLSNKVGLNNLGCICYMNSMMQQLFSNERLRNNVFNLNLKNEKDNNLLVQTQLLFSHLLKYEFKSIKPSNFVVAFDQNINIYEQKDVDEFFNELCEKYENTLKSNKLKNPFNDEFEGSYANELIGKTCPHRSEKEESFKCITLTVKNSIEESLQFLVSEEILDGDNAFYCEECQSKVSAIKRLSIKKPPKNLILVLKRFDFNYDTEMKYKLNNYCKFGSELDLEPFIQETFTKMSCSNLMNDSKNEKTMYDLKGIIIHSGSTENGHYYSLIKQTNEKNKNNKLDNCWLEFNDANVKPFNYENIGDFYGGVDIITNKDGNKEEIPKSANAYVLFYERRIVSKINDNYFNQQNNDLSKEEIVSNIIIDKINQENFNSWVTKTIMNKCFLEFIINFCIKFNFNLLLDGIPANDNLQHFYYNNYVILKNYNVSSLLGKDNSKNINEKLFKYPLNRKDKTSALSEYIKSNIEELSIYQNIIKNEKNDSFKILCMTFFNCTIRLKDKSLIPLYVDLIKILINQNLENAIFLLNEFDEVSIKEYLIDNPIQDMKRLTCGIIQCSLYKIFKVLSEELLIYCNKSKKKEVNFRVLNGLNVYDNVICRFINILISTIRNIKTEDLTYVYCLLSRITQLGNDSNYSEVLLYIKGFIHESGLFEYIHKSIINEGETKISFKDENEFEFKKSIKTDFKFNNSSNNLLSRKNSVNKTLMPFEENQENKIKEKLNSLKNPSFKLIILIEMIYNITIPFKSNLENVDKDCISYIDYNSQTLNAKKEIIQLLTFNSVLYYKILENLKTKSASVIWNKFALVSSYNNMEYTKKFINIIFEYLEKNDFDEIDYCLSFLKNLILLEDSLTKQRRSEIILNLYRCYEKNKKYYRFTESLIDFTIKLFTTRKNIHGDIENFSKLLKVMYDWIKENPVPPMYQNSNYLTMFKFKIHKIPNSLNQQIINNFNAKYQKISSDKLNTISYILKSKLVNYFRIFFIE